jgi:integrase
MLLNTLSKPWQGNGYEKKDLRYLTRPCKDIWRSLERNIFPGLGNVPINEIRPKLLKQHLDPIEQRGVLETLRRIISR